MGSGVSGAGRPGGLATLAEMASCQMEYRYLAHLTGRRAYLQAVSTPVLSRQRATRF